MTFRGVCVLVMGSRILAQFISKRLRKWSKKLVLLNENQSGFRPGITEADATQTTRTTADMKKIISLRTNSTKLKTQKQGTKV